jgi:hypothetical protein
VRRLAAVVSLALAIAASLYALGARAPGIEPAPRQAPDVVGLTLSRARAALARAGPVHVRVRRVDWAPHGVVGGVRGFGFDGAYVAGDRLLLQVGR